MTAGEIRSLLNEFNTRRWYLSCTFVREHDSASWYSASEFFNFCLIGIVRGQRFSNHSSVNTTTISLTETAKTNRSKQARLQLLLIKGVQTPGDERRGQRKWRVSSSEKPHRVLWPPGVQRCTDRFAGFSRLLRNHQSCRPIGSRHRVLIVFLLRSLPFPPRVMLTRTRNTVYSSFILATRAGRVPFHPLLDFFSPSLRLSLSLSLSHKILLFTNLDLHPTGRSDHQRPVNHSRRERTLWVVSEADRSTTEP